MTGFSPFQLIHFNIRGRLEVVRDSWLEGDTFDGNLLDWVEQLKYNMIYFSVIAGDRTACAKCKMKGYYDRNAGSELSFSPGSMILVHIPGLSSKFTDSWEGPFEVLRQVTPVTWEISVPNTRKKTRIIHANMMKAWHTAEARVCWVVVATEDDDPDPPIDLPTKRLTKFQLSALQNIQSSFSSLLKDAPGSTSLIGMSINTGDASPFQSVTYRLPVTLLGPVKDSLESLLSEAIIEPSTGPWSSPMLSIRKKDGSIRICIDYRRLNSVTIPDPYLMP